MVCGWWFSRNGWFWLNGRNHPNNCQAWPNANLVETQDAQEEEYEMVGIPKWHPPESLLIRPSVIPSILQPAHRAIVHGKATGDPVELLMKCLKFKKFMALWNVWRIWRILGCLFCLGVCACLIWLAVISQSGSWYYTPVETPVAGVEHSAVSIIGFSQVLFRLANCVSAGGCCHVLRLFQEDRKRCFLSMTSNQTHPSEIWQLPRFFEVLLLVLSTGYSPFITTTW